MKSLYLNYNELPSVCKSVSGGANQNFLPFLFRLACLAGRRAAGGLGGAALKMRGNFWVCRASGASAPRCVRSFFQNVKLHLAEAVGFEPTKP